MTESSSSTAEEIDRSDPEIGGAPPEFVPFSPHGGTGPFSVMTPPPEGLHEFGDTLDRHTWEVLVALARTVDASSPWTANHSKRVASLATAIGRVFGLTLEQLGTLCCAAFLHDIGKVGVSTNILDKPGRLNRSELSCMEAHPEKGARILEPLTAYAPVVPIVLQHHERLDGTGYPNRLSGDEICVGARILAVADVYDALVSERPYRTPWDHRRAMGFIREGREGLFDTTVVEAFLDMMTSRDGAAGEKDKGVTEVVLDVAPTTHSIYLECRPTLFERK